MKTTKLFKAIVSLMMVLSLLVGGSLMFVGCNNTEDSNNDKNNAAQYEGLEKEAYLQKLGENHLGAAIDSLGEVYGSILEGMGDSSAVNAAAGSKLDLTLTLGDKFLAGFEDGLEQGFGGDMDFSFLSKINLSMDMSIKDQVEKMQLTLGLNGQQIVTLNMLMNMADYIMYVAAPELNDGWIKFDMGEMMDDASVAGMMNSAAMMTTLVEALPDADTLTKVLDRYLNLVLPELDNVEQSTTTLEVSDVKQECTVLTLKIYEADALAIAKAVLNAAKDDADLKKIIEDVAKAMEELSGEDIGADEAYEDFREGVMDALAELNAITETDTESPIQLDTYVDKNHNIIGMKLSMPGHGTRGMVYYYTITEGDQFAFEAAIPSDVDDTDDAKISGTGTKKDGKTNADYTFSMQGTTYATIKIENWTEDGGTLTVTPDKSLLQSMFGIPAFDGELALQIKIAGEAIELNLINGSELAIGLALKAIQSTGPNLSEPSDATDAMDSTAMQKWAEKLDLTKVLDNLEKAGVPSALIEGIMSGMSGSSNATQSTPNASWDAA